MPVRNGKQIHLELALNQPACIYLIWIDGQGVVDPLYPWDRSFQSMPAYEPAENVHSPVQGDSGWPVNGPSGLETALLLVRGTPLPPETDLAAMIGKVSRRYVPIRWNAVFRLDAGQPAVAVVLEQHRGLGRDAKKIDEQLLQLMEPLRPHFEMIRAVRFAHEGE